jgi:hypothetical protein
MKHLFLLSVFFILSSLSTFSFSKSTIINCSVKDASIYSDGQLMGQGSVEIDVKRNACVFVKIERAGFVTQEKRICNTNIGSMNKSYFIDLLEDEAFNASSQNAISNTDFEVKTNLEYEEAWRLISQIVMSHNDVVEVIDGKTGYIRTGWNIERYPNATVRTRIIVRQFTSSPIGFKVKIVSEISIDPNASVKNDEMFKEWDRLLRKYENLIPEVQSRLK